jgi:formylglycine-generating enzyme required for sulfatase activity
MGRYPVTVEEYRRFVEDEDYKDERWWTAGGYGDRSEPGRWDDQKLHPNRAVIRVSWYEAAAYCAWAGGRLPTEEEWEFAARGTAGRKYPWGKGKPTVGLANYGETGPGHPTPVGMYPNGATPEGTHDASGNVWEWTSSEFVSYANGKPIEEPGLKVVRGGSWIGDARFLRAAFRFRYDPGYRDDSIGFRCAREVFP